jgi:L-asparaginase
MSEISIITVGGTIDKIYFDAKSKYEVGPPNIEKVLSELNLSISYRVNSLMRKDSLDLTAADRALIAETVANDPGDRILITHGTDTMVETAKELTAIAQKTIVLTGALEPALFKTSDAIFNIGCALGAVQSLLPGVYIVMNGKVFPAGQVRKNLEKNKFETAFPTQTP